MKRSVAMVSIFTLCWFAGTLAANRYVKGGLTSGNNLGTSWDNAWRSLAGINWNLLEPGDTLFISGGTDSLVYNEKLVVGKGGSTDGHLVIKTGQEAGHNGRAIISQGISMRYGKSYIIVDGNMDGKRHLVVKNPTGVGVDNYLGSHNVFTYLEVTECGNSSDNHGIGIRYLSHDIRISHCHVHNVYQDAINININGNDVYDDFIVEYCLLENMGDDGIQCGGGITVQHCTIIRDRDFIAPGAHPDGIQMNPNHCYLKVCNNIIKNASQNIFVEKSVGHVLIYNNILCQDPEYTKGTGRGVAVGTSSDHPTEGPFVIANNVFYNFNSYISAQVGAYSCCEFNADDQLVMANNIFLNNRIHFSGALDKLSVSNIFYNSPEFKCYDSSSGSLLGGCSFGDIPAGAITADPKVTNYTGYDFTLLPGSPAIRSGQNLSQYFTTDFNGNQRPATGAWDMGAIKYTNNNISWQKAVGNWQALPTSPKNMGNLFDITGKMVQPGQANNSRIYIRNEGHPAVLLMVK